MEPTGLRDVFNCITLSFAAMDDFGHPKHPNNNVPHHPPHMHRMPPITDAAGMHHHIQHGHLHITDGSRNFHLEKDAISRKQCHHSVISDPQALMISQCPPHNSVIDNAFAALGDIGLHPKNTNNGPPIHRPTVTEAAGMHHIQQGHLHITDASRHFHLEKDGTSRIQGHSVITDPQALMLAQCPPQNSLPLVLDNAFSSMEDIGLLPKNTNMHMHRPTITDTAGMHHHIQQGHLHITDGSRNYHLEKDVASRIHCHSVITDQMMMAHCPVCPPQNSAPFVLDNARLNMPANSGSTASEKAGPARKKAKSKSKSKSSKPRVAEPSKWKQNQQKQLRMEGKAYVSKRKKDGEAVKKQPRTIGSSCTSKACKKASNRFCHDFKEEIRQKMFDGFWQGMNWSQRKIFIAGLVDRVSVERTRAAKENSRRSVSMRYHLRLNGKRKQVCKHMFLATLGVGEWSVQSWAQKKYFNKKTETQKKKIKKKQETPQTTQKETGPVVATTTSQVNQEEHDNSSDHDESLPLEPIEQEQEGPSKKKSRVAKPLQWKQNKQKQLRMQGKSYITKRKRDGSSVTKEQRKMGAGCASNACKRASSRFCTDINEDTRKEIFDKFWNGMNWTERKVHIAGLVDRDIVERTRAPWTQSRRTVSLRYHLIVAGDRKQVCKKMFLSTFGVGEWSVLNWAQSPTNQQTDSAETLAKEKKLLPRKSPKASEHSVLREFLESLPKVPSYPGSTSVSKLYLEPVFSNMADVYRHYQNHCLEKQTKPLSRQVFCVVFKRMDLGLCDPKKDQSCSTYNSAGNLFNELWEEYCMESEAAGGPHPQKAVVQ